MIVRSEVAESFRRAAEDASQFLEWTGRRETLTPARLTVFFRRLRANLAALPLSQDTYSLLINTVTDAETLIASHELGAASWQLRQLERRLRRLETDWNTSDSQRGVVVTSQPVATAASHSAKGLKSD